MFEVENFQKFVWKYNNLKKNIHWQTNINCNSSDCLYKNYQWQGFYISFVIWLVENVEQHLDKLNTFGFRILSMSAKIYWNI